ncbi:hypothetical protein OWM54_24745 [Myxococcus sp. MISCRS1]|jgi:hypothetical protein|uniref:hypothetical protein n=1 Tax=Myxococcus TaxID=32 RepID=UPI0011437358|nr:MULTISPECIES: hypothetical protein [Myxococcus]BDT38108.1 hypothetical protein MFMH1_77770 [Myxococcus sp. MH1]MBZ4396592.1 hypothetical protein [Myxococcus sp. AS-1-15]MBZ4411700.1 hypothetical protein [Myxococcus sp. XM-1-1-1]MCK8500863.1 hypothetical protein [Myxococcus fulvus]MCY1000355.1 hypothetical protein [Myxococcus sp. MISCRS1]
MRHAALALFLCVLSLPALAEERKGRARVSANGLYSVRMVDVGPGRCRLEVTKESGPVWQLEQCLGTVDDFYFVSNDGERVWVLWPLVEKGKARPAPKTKKGKKPKGPPDWATEVLVAGQYGRDGQRILERRLTDLVPAKQLSEVRHMTHHLKWLEGTLGIPGKGPRLTDAGVVEFEPVGGTTRQLNF